MAEDEQVDRALGELACGDARLEAPPAVEAAVMQAFRHARTGRQRMRMALAVAAALVIGIGAALLWPGAQPLQQVETVAPAEVGTDYFPLRAGPVLDAGEIGQVMRVPVSRTTLARFGLSQADSETVQAEVLIGMDGTARAVRFVR